LSFWQKLIHLPVIYKFHY